MTLPMFGSIVAFKNDEGQPLAFHTKNLEVAKISEEAFSFINHEPKNELNLEQDIVFDELKKWSDSDNLAQVSWPKNNPRIIDHLLINNTQICNLKCTYCAAGGDGTYGDPVVKISIEKTLPQLEFFLNKRSNGDQFRVNFVGGEPLLHPEIIEAICDYAENIAQKRGIELRFVVTTNGTCIDDLAIQVLKKAKAYVNVSIDGPAEINDKMRPQKNGNSVTAKVIEGIQRLILAKQNLGGIGLTAVFSEMHTDVMATYEFFKTFQVDWYEFNFSHTEKSEEASREFSESLTKVIKQAWQVGGEAELLKIRSVNVLFQRLDDREPVTHFCGIRKNLLVIDARNQYYACPWDVGIKNKVISNSEIVGDLSGPVVPTSKSKLVGMPPCQTCWMQNLCGGGCEFIHKSSDGFDTNFCNRMKSLIRSTFIYYEKSRRI